MKTLILVIDQMDIRTRKNIINFRNWPVILRAKITTHEVRQSKEGKEY
jgi:hypothetical protein